MRGRGMGGNNSSQPLSQREPEVDFATKSLLSGQVPHIQWRTFKREQQGHSLGIRVSLKVWRRRVKTGSGWRLGNGGGGAGWWGLRCVQKRNVHTLANEVLLEC